MLYRDVDKKDGSLGKWLGIGGKHEIYETSDECFIREVMEESGAKATIVSYIDETQFQFNSPEGKIHKHVKWFLMKSDSYYSKPQREEDFQDSGYYKYHEAIHLLYFQNEKYILEKAYEQYKIFTRRSS